MKLLSVFRLFPSACCACLLMTLAGGGAACGQNADVPEAKTKDEPVATVNGKPILASELKSLIKEQVEEIRGRLKGDPAQVEREIKELKSRALGTLIDHELLVGEFYKIGGILKRDFVDKDLKQTIQEGFGGKREAFVAELAKGGMTLETYHHMRERAIIIEVMRARFAGKAELTDEMVREHYEKNRQEWRSAEQLKFHTLTLSKKTANVRSLAESLQAKLVNGGDFEVTARENSKDRGAADGGAWGWTDLSAINSTLSAALKKMKPGEISEVLEQKASFTIVRLDGRKEPEQKPFESVKDEVTNSLREKLDKERIEGRMVRLREAADIQKMGPV